MTYTTSSIDLANKFQQICHRIGLGAIIKKRRARALAYKPEKLKGVRKQQYEIYVLQPGCRGVKTINSVPYDARVWCVTVPSGYIMIRYNGKIGIVGNCDACALSMLSYSPLFKSSIEIVQIEPMSLGFTGIGGGRGGMNAPRYGMSDPNYGGGI